MNKATKQWLHIAEYDLETAKAMLKTGRYLYVAFMCHQSLEKLLKGIISNKKEEMPPYTHNLVLLANLSGILFRIGHVDFLAILNPYNIEARYPKTKQALSKLCTKRAAASILKRTEKLFIWLKQKLN